VAKISYEQHILERESQKRMSELDDQSHLARMHARADADHYSAQRQAAANEVGS